MSSGHLLVLIEYDTQLKSWLSLSQCDSQDKQLTTRPMSRVDAWKMVQRWLEDAGIGGGIGFGCHALRTRYGTSYLTNDGELEVCQMLVRTPTAAP